MILRNPSTRRDSLFLACSFLFCFFSHALSAQGVTGFVKEGISQSPISNATLSVIHGDSVLATLSTDSLGRYEYLSMKAIRIQLSLVALGYKPFISEDLVLDGYSTFRLDHYMEIAPYELEGVTVVSSLTQNLYSYRITKDDLSTVAGNFDDPVRVAFSKPGVVMINDQANHISVRGESPLFNSWYLEGLEIVNPNHTNNAGTLSDFPTQSGGGINLFSAQVLGSTDLYTGLNPMDIGRSAGAVIDMHLHETEKPEFRAKAGFLGFEFGGGQGIGKNGILDLNLRYSFTGLLADMGVDFGGEQIGFYDGVMSFRHSGAKHNLKIYSWAGRSENEFNHVEDPDEITQYKDLFDIDYRNDLYGAGIRFDYVFNSRFNVHTGASYSRSFAEYRQEGQFDSLPVLIEFFDEVKILSTLAEFNFKISNRVRSTVGVNYTRRYVEFSINPLQEESFIRPHLSAEFDLSQQFKLETGVELNHSFWDEESEPGYRAVLKWNKDAITIYGGLRHAAGQALTDPQHTELTEPIIIDKYEIGFNSRGKKSSNTFKLFREHIHRLSIYDPAQGIVHIADYFDPIIDLGVPNNNIGIGHYYGFEEEYKFRSPKGWSYTFNATFYQSERGSKESGYKQGKFNGNASGNLLIAKEIIQEKKGKNRIWNFSARGIVNGGLWEPIIDTGASQMEGSTVYIDPGSYSLRLPNYGRIDMSISRTIATSKIRWRYALDVQNLLGLTNIGYHYYDPYLQRIEAKEQLGIIPVFSIQASW